MKTYGLGNMIEKNKEKYSSMIMANQYSQDNVDIDSIPNKLKEKYLQDSSYHLTFLANSLKFSSIKTYKEYMTWLAELMKDLEISLEDMLKYFLNMESVLKEQLSEFDLQELEEYFSEGSKVFKETYSTTLKNVEKENYSQEVNQFVDYILEFKRDEATKYVLELLEKEQDIKMLYLDLFQPALYKVGVLWQKQEISVAKEHYASSVIQSIIGMLYPHLFKNNKRNGKVFVGASSGSELHEIGLRMVADFLEIDGWDTHYLGANLPIEYVIEEVRDVKPDVLGISTTTIVNLSFARELIQEIKNDPLTKNIKIMVGGRVYNTNDELWKEVGADAYALNAESAVSVANELTEGEKL